MLTNFVDVLGVGDLEDGVPAGIMVAGSRVCLVRDGENVFAFTASCSHEEVDMVEGWYENGCIECPQHGSRFDCRTGAVLSPPASSPIKVFETRIENGRVLVNRGTSEG
jgi:3-phenylpropionate/trans-cinnamate dioxygenase ferredoxin component